MKTIESNYPLLIAARDGDVAAMEEAIKGGAQVDFIDQNDIRLPSLLHVVAEDPNCKNKLQVIECLVKNGADVNAVDVKGSTVLHYAIAFVDLNAIKCLVSLGAVVTPKIAAFAAAYLDFCLRLSPARAREFITVGKEIRTLLFETLIAYKYGREYRETINEYVSALEVAQYSLTKTTKPSSESDEG